MKGTKIKMMRLAFIAVAVALLTAGCANYRWSSRVPEEIRTVAVPVFQNSSSLAELGPMVSQYTLREFQREGTFSIRRSGDSSIEVQGRVAKVDFRPIAFDRGRGMRAGEYRCFATLEVAVVDKEHDRDLISKRVYKAETTITVQGDLLTARRNCVPRLATEFARQIVDDVLSYPYNRRR
jgi:hypothetical protein